MHILCTALNLMTVKTINIETLSAYLRIHMSTICSMIDKKKINDRVIEITCILQEIIEKFTS